MPFHFSRHFQKDFAELSKKQKNHLNLVLEKLSNAVNDSHQHQGLGIRKLHRSGIFEARLGLELRLIFTFDKTRIILHRLGSHDEIKKYLKNL